MTQTLSQLENRGAFIERHIGRMPSSSKRCSKQSARIEQRTDRQIVPKDIQLATPPQVGGSPPEFAALAELKVIAGRNKRFKSYIGMGYTPCSCRRLSSATCWKTRTVHRVHPV
ncbi:hypothetical protein ACNKHQ_16615 [Shigella flexneri]